MRVHATTEALLAESGLPFTALRNGYYTASALGLLGSALQTGELALPEEGPVAWTAHDDLAEAAALVLVDRGPDCPTPPLTAGAALTLAEVARAGAELTGRRVTARTVSDEERVAALVARGLPESTARFLLTISPPAAARSSPRSIPPWSGCSAVRRGRSATSSPTHSAPRPPARAAGATR